MLFSHKYVRTVGFVEMGFFAILSAIDFRFMLIPRERRALSRWPQFNHWTANAAGEFNATINGGHLISRVALGMG